MELVDEELFPGFPQGFRGIGAARKPAQGRSQLHVAQEDFQLPVLPLQVRLGGEGAAMHLQVQLAIPDGQVLRFVEVFLQVLLATGEGDLRHGGYFTKALHGVEHLLGNAAAAVAVAVHAQRGRAGVFILVGVPVLHDLRGRGGGDEMGGRDAGVYLAAVQPAPDEAVVRETVCVVPGGHLVGNVIPDAALPQDLRQDRAGAEHIGQPAVAAGLAELLAEIPLAVEELPGKAFRRGNIAVRFHVHSAGWLKLPGTHLFRDAGEQVRIVFLQGFKEERLGMGIDEGWEAVHELQLDQAGARVFLHGMDAPPVVGDIQVAVGDQRHRAAAPVERIAVELLRDVFPGLFDAALRIPVHDGQRVVQAVGHEGGVVLVELAAAEDIIEQGDIMVQGGDVFVLSDEPAALEHLAAALVAHGILVPVVIWLGTVVALDIKDVAAVRGGREQQRFPVGVDAALQAAVDAHEHFACGGEHEPQVFRPAQFCGHFRLRMEEGGSVRGEVFFPPDQRAGSFVIHLIGVLPGLAPFPDGPAGDLRFLRDEPLLQPADADPRPFIGQEGTADYLDMCHLLTSSTGTDRERR